MKMLDVAKKYLKAGFSVIPLNGKIPAIEWKEYQTRYPTEEELEQWFSDGKKNIGIVTGEISGITVVDVDVKSGGLETLKELHLPITWTVRTGGGGWHYYYKYCPEAQQTAGIYQGIDIRNIGGQVVAPPSIHQSGNKYEWVYKEDELVDFPIDLFKKENVVKSNDWKEVLTKGAGEGTRNETASKVFGKLLTVFKQEEWEYAWQIGKSWNLNNKPPLPEDELRMVFESIGKRQLLKTTKTLAEIISTNETPLELAQRVKIKAMEKRKFFTWGDAHLDEDYPLLETGTYTILFGQFTSGKTTYAMYMARRNAEIGHKVCFLSLEMSREKLIRQYAFKREGVTKQDYKNGNFENTIFEKYANELTNIDYIGVDDEKAKKDYSPEDVEEIVKTKKPDLLFIDNFNKLKNNGQGEVESNNDMSSKLLFITRKYPVCIILIHHANKPQRDDKKKILRGISALRGSNKLCDDADIICEMGRPNREEHPDLEKNLSHFAVYKDRDWDEKIFKKLYFINGGFYETNHELSETASAFGGIVMPSF